MEENSDQDKFSKLRRRAQVFLAARQSDSKAISPEDVTELIHELDTYQIELELQNEDLRKAQLELEKSRKKYIDHYDFAPVGYLTVSDKGLIIEANLTASELLAVDRGHLLMKPLSAFIVESDQDIYYKHRQHLLKSKKRQSCELRILQRNSPPLDVLMEGIAIPDDDGETAQLRICITDISKQKKIADTLRTSKEEWEKTFNSIPDIVTLQDTNMTIVRANKAAHDFLGCTYGELFGKYCYEVFCGLSEPCPGCPLLDTLKDAATHSKTIDYGKLGKTFLVSSSAISGDNGSPHYVVHIAKDITEQKKLEEERFQAHKLEAIGTLAGGIAHDFNNILTAIIGFTELAQTATKEGSKTAGYLAAVLQAGQRATGLVKQILTFSRKGAHNREALQPYLVVKEALRMLRASLPTTVQIRENIDSNSGTIVADPTKIHQVVVNLCTNALHAMTEETGTLEVSLQRTQLTAEEVLAHSGVAPGPFIELSVSDTGCGMDEQTRQHIFEPYFTTKAVDKGSGLGLAVVLGVVQDYGGIITVDSTPGKGSTFHVFFPAQGEEEDKAEVSQKKRGPLPTGTERIMIVDDESTIVTLYEAVLSSLGYTVTPKTSSLAALEELQKSPGSFDILITDQTMPGLSGVKLAEEVLKFNPEMPIILCTGFSSTLSEEQALKIGIKRFVQKPVNCKDLARIVRSVLDGD